MDPVLLIYTVLAGRPWGDKHRLKFPAKERKHPYVRDVWPRGLSAVCHHYLS